jgi:hypothetical protein
MRSRLNTNNKLINIAIYAAAFLFVPISLLGVLNFGSPIWAKFLGIETFLVFSALNTKLDLLMRKLDADSPSTMPVGSQNADVPN